MLSDALSQRLREAIGEVGGRPTELTPGERSAIRAWLVPVCIRAYFGAP